MSRLDPLTEPAELHRLIAAQAAELATAKAGLLVKALEVEKLRVELARLKRQRYGRSSEKLSQRIEQLELGLEEREIGAAASDAPPACAPQPCITAEAGKPDETDSPKRNGRRPLPEHLARTEVVHTPASCRCAACGGGLRVVGEDVSEVLDYVPGRFEVVRHVRPAFSCRSCESMVQVPMPSLPIERGRPGPGLLAHVLVSKYADHLPLYRQSGIYAREGVVLERATLADWVGKTAALVRPLVEAIESHVMAAERLHADDTPVPVLAPGTGKTRTGRQWVYVRDERPYGGPHPPAVLYRYSPDRKGEHPRAHLKAFRGLLQADGYAGFNALYESRNGAEAPAVEVACWAHVRRKFFDVHEATGSLLAREALERMGALFAIERTINGQPPEERRRVRQLRAKPLLDELKTFLDQSLSQLSAKSVLAGVIRYARGCWPALVRYVDDGRLEMTNNAAERAIRPLTLGRKNWVFAGSDEGGHRAAAMYTLIETAKLNGLDPEAYLANVLSRIAAHPINRIADLLPWKLAPPQKPRLAA
jgi:transposase